MTASHSSNNHDHHNFHNHGHGLGLVHPRTQYYGHEISHDAHAHDHSDYRLHLNPNDPIVDGLYDGPIPYDSRYEITHGPHHGVRDHHAPHDFHGHHADNGSGVHGHSIHDTRFHPQHNYNRHVLNLSHYEHDLATRPSYMNYGPKCDHHYKSTHDPYNLDSLSRKYSDLQAKVSYLAHATVPWATSCSCFNCKLITKYHY